MDSVIGWFVAQGNSGGVLAGWLPLLALLISAGTLFWTAQRNRVENRKTTADTRKSNLEADGQELELLDKYRQQLENLGVEMEVQGREMAVLRDRVLAAEAEAAKADARAAIAHAETAAALAKASEERHDLKNQIYIRDGRLLKLEQEIASLRAQLDERHDRRDPTRNS